jgi:Holliday junction DNA helicase RuvA
MIARITGRLEELTPTSALVDVGGGLWYEVLVPACDSGQLTQRLGQEVTLHTLHFIEGDASFGSQTPRLVGFLRATDRQFFRTFTTVKGIGIRTALKALERPVGEIASAIQGKDARFLATLPKIGKRTAEQIIAELHGKVEAFVGPAAAAVESLPQPAAEAVAVLVQLGERRPDAQALVERVLAVEPELKTPEEIIRLVYRLKGGAK